MHVACRLHGSNTKKHNTQKKKSTEWVLEKQKSGIKCEVDDSYAES